MGFVCGRFSPQQQSAHHRGRPYRIVWRHPLLHYVCGKFPNKMRTFVGLVERLIHYVQKVRWFNVENLFASYSLMALLKTRQSKLIQCVLGMSMLPITRSMPVCCRR